MLLGLREKKREQGKIKYNIIEMIKFKKGSKPFLFYNLIRRK